MDNYSYNNLLAFLKKFPPLPIIIQIIIFLYDSNFFPPWPHKYKRSQNDEIYFSLQIMWVKYPLMWNRNITSIKCWTSLFIHIKLDFSVSVECRETIGDQGKPALCKIWWNSKYSENLINIFVSPDCLVAIGIR